MKLTPGQMRLLRQMEGTTLHNSRYWIASPTFWTAGSRVLTNRKTAEKLIALGLIGNETKHDAWEYRYTITDAGRQALREIEKAAIQ